MQNYGKVTENFCVLEVWGSTAANFCVLEVWGSTATTLHKLDQDRNSVSENDAKSFPLYDRLNQILGTWAASSPPVVLESGGPSSGDALHVADQPQIVS